ncbi:hypothetical protein [Paenibacillus sp. KR2-11]|uniref:hypothetical protein n=1 Tax=Paenibacillus sp. KR2-11 TaxID=3385500 RepID=UPI0038FD2549
METRRITLHEILVLKYNLEKENSRNVEELLIKQPREILEKITIEIIEEITFVIEKISRDKENSSNNNLKIISWLTNCIKILLRRLKNENERLYLQNGIRLTRVIIDVICKHYKIPYKSLII